jgi:hypothetical protein
MEEMYKNLFFYFFNILIATCLIELGLKLWQERKFSIKKCIQIFVILLGIGLFIGNVVGYSIFSHL